MSCQLIRRTAKTIINFLVDKIKKNSVNEQIIKLEAEFNDRQFNLLTVMLALSLVTIIAFVWWGVSSKRAMQEVDKEQDREPEMKSSQDNVPPFSSAEDCAFEEPDDNVMSSAIKQSENDSYLSERDSRDQNSELQPPKQPGVAIQQTIQHNTEEAQMSEGYIVSVTDSKPEIDIEEMLVTIRHLLKKRDLIAIVPEKMALAEGFSDDLIIVCDR